MRRTADAVVIGGGVIGAAAAYYLQQAGLATTLIERAYLAAGSTGRCIGGIRAQFGTETTIRVMLDSIRRFRGLAEELATNIDWFAGGYLFLVESEARKQSFLKVMALQQRLGLDVRFIPPDDAARLVPGLNVGTILGGVYCPTDGQANPFAVTYGYARRFKARGGTLASYTEVVAIERAGRSFELVTATGDRFTAPVVVAAAGPWSQQVGAMVGLTVPVAAERHESLVTEGVDRLFDPMLVDYRDGGCYFHQHVRTGHMVGCYTPVPSVPGDRVDSSVEFLARMPARMHRLLPRLAAVKVLRQWAGSYEMTPDGSPLFGATPVEGFYVSGGMCGHGFMLAPALGALLAELVTTGRTALDVREFAFRRSFAGREELK